MDFSDNDLKYKLNHCVYKHLRTGREKLILCKKWDFGEKLTFRKNVIFHKNTLFTGKWWIPWISRFPAKFHFWSFWGVRNTNLGFVFVWFRAKWDLRQSSFCFCIFMFFSSTSFHKKEKDERAKLFSRNFAFADSEAPKGPINQYSYKDLGEVGRKVLKKCRKCIFREKLHF